MATDTILSIRTNSVLKNKAKKKFASFGLDLSTGINMYLSDIVRGEFKPVSAVRVVPKKTMREWEKRVKQAKKEKGYSNMKDLMDALNS